MSSTFRRDEHTARASTEVFGPAPCSVVSTGVRATWIDVHGHEDAASAFAELGDRVSLGMSNVGSHLVAEHTVYFPEACGEATPCRYTFTTAPK